MLRCSHHPQRLTSALGAFAWCSIRNDIGYDAGGSVWCFVFPEAQNDPTGLREYAAGVVVSSLVCLDLGPPPVLVGLWGCAVQGTAVPETSIDEDGNAHLDETDVCSSAKSRDWLLVDCIGEPESIQCFAQKLFCLGPAPTCRFHATSSCRGRGSWQPVRKSHRRDFG